MFLLSALLALCEGNLSGKSFHKGPVMWSFDFFFWGWTNCWIASDLRCHDTDVRTLWYVIECHLNGAYHNTNLVPYLLASVCPRIKMIQYYIMNLFPKRSTKYKQCSAYENPKQMHSFSFMLCWLCIFCWSNIFIYVLRNVHDDLTVFRQTFCCYLTVICLYDWLSVCLEVFGKYWFRPARWLLTSVNVCCLMVMTCTDTLYVICMNLQQSWLW